MNIMFYWSGRNPHLLLLTFFFSFRDRPRCIYEVVLLQCSVRALVSVWHEIILIKANASYTEKWMMTELDER